MGTPENHDLLQQAEAMAYDGRYDELARLCEQVLASDPGNARAYFLRGCAHLAGERPSSAKADFERAVRLDRSLLTRIAPLIEGLFSLDPLVSGQDEPHSPMDSGAALDGACPWCGLSVDAGFSNRPTRHCRRCPCGAIALGAPSGSRAVMDALLACYGISPSAMHGDIYAQTQWLKDFSIQSRPGGRGAAGPAGEAVEWTWFKRELPGQPPAGPMSDEARLAWLKSQGETCYDRMYDSRNPAAEFRQAKEAFEDAIALARKLARAQEAAALAARLEHIRKVFFSQFSR